MSIEAVVRNIDLAADKPLGVRRLPIEDRVPLLEPMKLLRHARPKRFRVGARLRAQALQFFNRLDVRLLRKCERRRKEPTFLL